MNWTVFIIKGKQLYKLNTAESQDNTSQYWVAKVLEWKIRMVAFFFISSSLDLSPLPKPVEGWGKFLMGIL